MWHLTVYFEFLFPAPIFQHLDTIQFELYFTKLFNIFIQCNNIN